MEAKKIADQLSVEIKKQVFVCFSILILLVSSATTANSQRIWIERKGCFRGQGNLGVGYLFKQKHIAGYLNGEMELFLDNSFSFTGSLSYSFLTLKKNQTGIQKNHAVYAGANYHFLKPGKIDPYIGLTPGIGMVKVAYLNGEQIQSTPYSIVPLISAQAGFNFYICSFLNFFVKVQGISGQVFSVLPEAQRLDELKCMGGMGVHFRMWRPQHPKELL